MVEIATRESEPESSELLTRLRRLSEHENFVVQTRCYPGKVMRMDVCAMLAHIKVYAWDHIAWFMSAPEYAMLREVNEQREPGSPSMLSEGLQTLLGIKVVVVNGIEGDRITLFLIDQRVLDGSGRVPYVTTTADGFTLCRAIGLVRE